MFRSAPSGNSSSSASYGRSVSFSSMFPATTKAQLGFLNERSRHTPFVYNHSNYIYWPHSSQGRVGTTASSSRAQRRRV